MTLAQNKNIEFRGMSRFRVATHGCPRPCAAVYEFKAFFDEEDAMVGLGVGKNMVRSIRFWSQVASMATAHQRAGAIRLRKFGIALLGERGLDPFLEDIRTLWLIHWNLVHRYRKSAFGLGLSAQSLAGA